MKDHFNKPENCPAWCFYKADEDVRYLMIDNDKPISEAKKHQLRVVLIDLKEWFSKEYNEKAYKQNLGNLNRKSALEIKLLALNDLLKTLEVPGEYTNLSEFMSPDNIEKLKELCKSKTLRLAFMSNADDMRNQIRRIIKGVKNDYNRNLSKFEERNVEFNYMRSCINVLRGLGMQRDPLKITLIEWLEMLKLSQDV